MKAIKPSELIGQLNWRYATKQFDPQRRISPEDWAVLEESVRLTPSSYGLQPWKLVVVTDPGIREQLRGAAYGQPQVVEASHLVVFAVQSAITEQDVDEYLDRIAEIRGVARESLNGFRDVLIGGIMNAMDGPARQAWAARQAYIALGNLLNSAALLGIDACPMEGFQPKEFDRILGLAERGLHAVVMVAAGYRSAGDKYAGLKKVRLPKEQVLIRV